MIGSAEVANKTPFATINITGGVLAGEAMALFNLRMPSLRHSSRRPLVALFGHPTRTDECLLSGVKRT